MSGADDALSSWIGARVERVDGPTPGLFSLVLYRPGQKACLLLAVGPQLRGVGVSRERPKGEAASAYVRRLRTKLENARLAQATWLGSDDRATALALRFSRLDGEVTIAADFDAKAPALLLLEEGRIVGSSDEGGTRKRFPDRKAPYVPSAGRGIARVDSDEELAARGQALLEGEQARGTDARITQARTNLKGALKRAQRKAEAIRGDLARASQAPVLRREADLIYCHLHAFTRGQAEAELLDEAVEPAEIVRVTLDPAKDARRNAEQRYERARKLERGAGIAQGRLDEVTREIERLEAEFARLDGGDESEREAALERLGLATRSARPLPVKKRPERKTHVAFRTFLGTDGRRIYVGKGAADNDTLTLTVARPHDIFLHVRGSPGAHVILPRDKNADVPAELLVDAAHLAAHFSSARGEPLVEVSHVERRHVRKPRGAAPGSVNVDREKVMLLRVERERLQRLLAAEKLD